MRKPGREKQKPGRQKPGQSLFSRKPELSRFPGKEGLSRFLPSRFLLLLFLLLVSARPALAQDVSALIETNRGEVHVELNAQAAPTTVANFVNLATRGFYDGLTWHRVEPRFMIQGGDPEGSGRGGPGYQFTGEIRLRHSRPGTLSMANSGPGTDGSQFFITHVPTPHLNGLHSVFGQVTQGQDVVNRIGRGDTIERITVSGDVEAVLERRRDRVAEWNAVLDEEFPDLEPALIVE
ncbi:MAG: peptidylprolyl isomerase [Pseudohongiellaceae bacterium]